MFGNLTDTEIEGLLNRQVIGRIGCHAGGTTYVVPISFAYDGKYIYGHTHEGMKINFMRENPVVCFEVDELINMADWKSVVCQGIFEELKDERERDSALQVLLKRPLTFISSKTVQLSPNWPFVPANLNNIEGIVYRILINTKTGRFERADINAYYAS